MVLRGQSTWAQYHIDVSRHRENPRERQNASGPDRKNQLHDVHDIPPITFISF